MKKRWIAWAITFFIALGTTTSQVSGQAPANYALIDMQYITSVIPEYKSAMEQIQKQTQVWQEKIKQYNDQAKEMYIQYQERAKTASAEDLVKLENAIIKIEEEAAKAQQQYFGRDGELMKLQEKLIKPIQDNIYEAVKLISNRRGYHIVFDRAASVGSIIYADPKADISNDVLAVLGYSKEKR